MLTQEGQIACECKQCRPGGVVKTPSVSCSEFEEHAGSRERRPAESIYLECIAISLKVLHAALRPDQLCLISCKLLVYKLSVSTDKVVLGVVSSRLRLSQCIAGLLDFGRQFNPTCAHSSD